MSRVVIVLPSIVPEITRACLATFSPETVDPEALPSPPTMPQRDPIVHTVNGREWSDGEPRVRLMVVWNTPERNAGVGQSWEMGRRECLRTEADWLWILSAGVRFGPAGGRDFLQRLDEFADVRPDVAAVEASDGLGWHCLGMSRRMVETVGAFDPIYEVGYFEDVDYSWRYQCAYRLGPEDYPLWPKVDIDASLTEVAHGIKHGGVTVDMAENERRFVAKWGGPSGSERWCHPYNDETRDHASVGRLS